MIKARYWLLDAAVELKLPLWLLARADHGQALNRPGHGCTAEEIAKSISAMVSAGELELWRWNAGGTETQEGPLSEDELLAGMAASRFGSRVTAYGLTVAGGACWEQWARPDWGLYASAWTEVTPSGAEVTEIIAASREIAEELFALEPHLNPRREILPRSIRRDLLGPWQATYWKSLSEGHRIVFRSLPKTGEQLRPAPDWAVDRLERIRRWYQRGPFS